MASLKDAAERQAFSLAIDATLKSLNKDREKGLLNIVNLAQKFMGSEPDGFFHRVRWNCV